MALLSRLMAMREYILLKMANTIAFGRKFMFTEVINQDDGVNMIVASCTGDQLSLTVNAEEIITVKDSNFINGELGIFLETIDEGNASATFNEFIVVKP